MAGHIHDWLTDHDYGRPDDHHPAVDEHGYALWTDPNEQRPAARWPEMAERAGAEEKTDAAGREWYAEDEATAWEDSADNPANYQAGGGGGYRETQQQEEPVVAGPLAEDRTQVGGLTGSFNTTDDDRAMLAQEQAYDRAAADAAVVAMLALPEQQHDRGDEYGANGRAADIDQVQLEDAASYGY